jgi:hypothetical protein
MSPPLPDSLGEDYPIFSQPLTMKQVSHSSSLSSFNKRLLYNVTNTTPTRKSFECGPQLDDCMAPNFNKANQRAHFLQFLWVHSWNNPPLYSFLSSCLLLLPLLPVLLRKKKKKKVQVFCNYSLRHCKL